MEANNPIQQLRAKYHHSDWEFQRMWIDAGVPHTVYSDFREFMREECNVGTVKKAWDMSPVINIIRSHLANSLPDSKLDSDALDRLAMSVYYLNDVNEMEWTSLMVFFFLLSVGQIGMTTVKTPQQLVSTLRQYYPKARDRESKIRKELYKEYRTTIVESDDAITWEEYSLATNKLSNFSENLIHEMQQEGYCLDDPNIRNQETGHIILSYAEWKRQQAKLITQ